MGTPKDDRIFLITRIVAGIIIVVLFLAFLALYIRPTHTDVNFAWTIQPPTTAILFGAGYTAGAFFFIRLLGTRKWHRVQAGFLPITAFTVFMLTSTLLHLSRFHLGTAPFILWTGVYILTPILVPLIWWLNRRTESKDLEGYDVRFSAWTRRALAAAGVVGVLFFLLMFIRPSVLISLAPWKLTELTARVFCGWSILAFASVISIARDGRWSAARIMVESALVAVVLTLIALPRLWGDLHQGNPMTYLFIAGLVLVLIGFSILHVRLDRSSRMKPALRRTGVADE